MLAGGWGAFRFLGAPCFSWLDTEFWHVHMGTQDTGPGPGSTQGITSGQPLAVSSLSALLTSCDEPQVHPTSPTSHQPFGVYSFPGFIVLCD